MVRKKRKGTRMQRAVKEWEEPNFYLPEWKNHFEASIPPALLEKQIPMQIPPMMGHHGPAHFKIENMACML